MALFKSARGLPRFMVDCGFWRHPRWKGADLDQMGLFVACLSYCYEHETDGILPGPDPEDLACALGLKPRHVVPALEGLLDRGSIVADAECFEIVAFAEHNPTKADIVRHREQRTRAGKKGAEARWGDGESHSESHADGMATGNGIGSKEPRAARGPAFGADFDTTWAEYPRKLARKAALGAYQARRREGISAADLHNATVRYAAAMRAEGRPADKVKHGKTFYGPDEYWRDYLGDVPAPALDEPAGLALVPDPAPPKPRCSGCSRLEIDCVCNIDRSVTPRFKANVKVAQ